MYRLTHRPKVNNDQSIIARSRSQYLKQNINPNSVAANSQLSLNSSIKNIPKMGNRKSSLTRLDSGQRGVSKGKPVLRKKQTPKPSDKTNLNIQDQDFIRPEDIGIGMNGKGVHNQLQNAMKRQIDKQKSQIEALNETVVQLKIRDKNQQAQIKKLNGYIQQLVEEVEQLRVSGGKDGSAEEGQQIFYLREQNGRLQREMMEMQQMIKSVLLERQKQRVFAFNR